MKKPIIFIYARKDHGNLGKTYQALAEDGTPLGSHISSTPSWAMKDMLGHKDDFEAHYPDGYELEFLENCNDKFHNALRNNKSKYGNINYDHPNNARIEVVFEDDDGKTFTKVIK